MLYMLCRVTWLEKLSLAESSGEDARSKIFDTYKKNSRSSVEVIIVHFLNFFKIFIQRVYIKPLTKVEKISTEGLELFYGHFR